MSEQLLARMKEIGFPNQQFFSKKQLEMIYAKWERCLAGDLLIARHIEGLKWKLEVVKV